MVSVGPRSIQTALAAGPPNYTNPGQRCQFDPTPTPMGSSWSFWEQTFCQDGTAQEVINSGITAGNTYTMTAQMAFQDGTGPGQGTNDVTAANQSAGTPNNGENGGNGYSYVGMVWLNKFGGAIGTTNADGLSAETMIPAGSVTTYAPLSPPAASNNGGFNPWTPYSVSGVAPAGAVGIELVLGWANGGMDGGTGGQAAVASDVTLVPEPASLSLLGLGGLSLLARRRGSHGPKFI